MINAKKRLLHSSSEHEYAYHEKADKKELRLLYTIYHWNPGLYIMSNNFRHRKGSVRMFGSGPNMDEVLKSKIVNFLQHEN